MIIYSPALDLSGYGNTINVAKKSFKIALEEFIRYTLNENTFNDVMKKLGWASLRATNPFRLSDPFLNSLYCCFATTTYAPCKINSNDNYKIFFVLFSDRN